MATVKTTVTTTITESTGTELTLTETQTVEVGGNPRFFAESVYLSGEELTARLKAMVENRHGQLPAGRKVFRTPATG